MDYLEFIKRELTKASALANRYFGKVSGSAKPDGSVLTEADLAIGKQLVSAVQTTYPDHNVIDEESGVTDKKSKFTWVIDPIEGTSNFAVGAPQYGIMIGLLQDATPIAGGVVAPAYDKLYLAQKGKGATCNGYTIRVSQEDSLSKMLISFSPGDYQNDPDTAFRDYRLVAEVALVCRAIRDSNCEATDTMYVAEGRYGGRVNLASKIWDNIAPHIINEEAGALWTTAHGKSVDYSNPVTKATQNFTFCVASPQLHQKLQSVIRDGYKAAEQSQ